MIRWAAGRPAVVWAVGASLVLAGGVAFTKLPLATKTQVELPRLNVTADWFGSSPELVETYLTSPLEEAIQGVRGVKKISSESGEGNARLEVELEPKTDVTLARLEIHERIELLLLSPNVQPLISSFAAGRGEVHKKQAIWGLGDATGTGGLFPADGGDPRVRHARGLRIPRDRHGSP